MRQQRFFEQGSYTEEQYVSSKFNLYVDKELNYLVRYYEWVVPKQHPVYKRYKGSMLNIASTNFISHLKSYSLCIGITAPDSQQAMSMTKHVISKPSTSFNIKTFNHKAHVIKYFTFDRIHVSCCYLMEKQYAKIAML